MVYSRLACVQTSPISFASGGELRVDWSQAMLSQAKSPKALKQQLMVSYN